MTLALVALMCLFVGSAQPSVQWGPPVPPELTGRACFERGNLECARSELTKAASEGTAPDWVLSLLGRTHLGLGEYALAQRVWERRLASSPSFRDAYFDLADAYLLTDRTDRALGLLEEGRPRWPQDVEFLNALGVLYFGRNEVKRAIDLFTEAIRQAPDDPTAYLNAGKAHEKEYGRSMRWDDLRRKWVLDSEAYARALAALRRCAELDGPLASEARARLSILLWTRDGKGHQP